MLARGTPFTDCDAAGVQFRNPGGDYMMRFNWRIQIAAASLVLGFIAVPAGADDSNLAPAIPAELAAPADTAAPAASPTETAPTTEALPPATAESAPATDIPPSGNAPAISDQSPGGELAPQCDPGFHPLAPLRQFHPLAPLRERFAACHTAPATFPGYDGEPRCVGLPAVRQACYAQQPLAGPPQLVEQPGQDAGPPVEGSAEPLSSAPLAACDADPATTWFGGADYYLIRPHQTYDSAFEIAPNGATGPSVQNVNFNPSFASAVRVFAGYETSCDEALRFSYTYMFNDTLRSASVPDGSSILSPLGATLFPGDSIVATEHLLLNAWDLEDVKKLNLPWCNCNGGCSDCPRWDVRWSWGVRLVQIDESILNEAFGPDAGIFTQKSTFVGVGPRLGIDVHRQIGHSRVSAYVAADAALLVGEQDTTGTNTPTGTKGVQALPNFDVQLGLSWKPTCHLNITTGYLFETFGDATQLSEAANLALVAPPQASTLSYDGFFFRGEFSY